MSPTVPPTEHHGRLYGYRHLVAAAAVLLVALGYCYWPAHHTTVTICRTASASDHQYLLDTSDGQFVIKPIRIRSGQNAAELRRHIKEGEAYRITFYGVDLPRFSLRRNVLSAQLVPNARPTGCGK